MASGKSWRVAGAAGGEESPRPETPQPNRPGPEPANDQDATDRHRRLWLQHALQSPQSPRYRPQ